MKNLTLKNLLQSFSCFTLCLCLVGCASVPSLQRDKDFMHSTPKGLIPVKLIGEDNLGSTRLNLPKGMAIDPAGNLYIVDTGNNRMVKCDKEGGFLKEVGGFGWDNREFNLPSYIAIDNGLSIYVTDTQNKRVQRFDNYLNFIQSISGGIEGVPFENSQLNGVALSRKGELYLSDSENDCVWKTDSQFGSVIKLGGFESGAGALNDPQGITLDERENLYVADAGNNRIAVYDPFGDFRWELGRGILDRPSGVEVSKGGIVYVANTFGDNIVVLDNNGSIIFKYGKRGSGEGEFNRPKDLKLYEGEKIYVVDSGNNRIHLLMLIK